MSRKAKILVVEDEPAILLGVRENLEMEGHQVVTAADGLTALRRVEEEDPDLVILDLMIPKLPGLDVLRKLRERRVRASVIVLTAKKQEEDKVRGLKLGADDYITKPFSLVEFLARVQAVLRRTERPKDPLREVRFSDVALNFDTFEVKKGDRQIKLTPREIKIMRLFVENDGRVISRNELLDKVWGYDEDHMPTTRTVDNHIVRLRKAVEDDPARPRHIASIRGVGYRFTRAPQEPEPVESGAGEE